MATQTGGSIPDSGSDHSVDIEVCLRGEEVVLGTGIGPGESYSHHGYPRSIHNSALLPSP